MIWRDVVQYQAIAGKRGALELSIVVAQVGEVWTAVAFEMAAQRPERIGVPSTAELGEVAALIKGEHVIGAAATAMAARSLAESYAVDWLEGTA